MRSFLLGLLILGFPSVSLATSIDYGSRDSIGAGTATLTGNATAGDSVMLTSPLVNINSVSATGTVTLAIGTLAATCDPNVFAFTGGTLTVVSPGNTLFHGAFSSGTLTITGMSAFTISGSPSNGTAFSAQSDTHGDVLGETIVTPEPSTLGLITTGTGLIGLAGMVRHKKRGSYNS